MGGQYGAAAGAGAYGVPGISGVGQMGMQAAARDMYAGASTYGARQQPVYGGYGALANGVGNRIVIENLPRTIMWQGLKDLFKRFGNVSRADVSTHIHMHTLTHTHTNTFWSILGHVCVLCMCVPIRESICANTCMCGTHHKVI